MVDVVYHRQDHNARDHIIEGPTYGALHRRNLWEEPSRSGVLFPDSIWYTANVQQRSIPDRRYGTNNLPYFDPRNFHDVQPDFKFERNQPRPLEAGMPYIPIAHILEMRPALNLFDVRVDHPELCQVLNDRYGNPNKDTMQRNDAQKSQDKLLKSKAYHLINSRGAWNSHKQLEFIWQNRAQDPQLSLYRSDPPPIAPI